MDVINKPPQASLPLCFYFDNIFDLELLHHASRHSGKSRWRAARPRRGISLVRFSFLNLKLSSILVVTITLSCWSFVVGSGLRHAIPSVLSCSTGQQWRIVLQSILLPHRSSRCSTGMGRESRAQILVLFHLRLLLLAGTVLWMA